MEHPVASTETIGNVLVASVLTSLGLFMLVGWSGVAFVGELAGLTVFVLGALMLRGSFGDNGTVASLLMVLIPVAYLLPLFFGGLWWLTPAAGGTVMVLGIAKFPGMW